MGIPKNTLYYYTHRQVIPYYKTGKRVFFKKEDLVAFILNEKNRYEVDAKMASELNSFFFKN